MSQIINNFIKKNFLVLMLILYSSFAAASSLDVVSDVGIITLTIVNRAPVITDIHFSPKIAFEDSKLECVTAVNDENTDEVILIYNWYVNNEVIETNDYYLIGFKENDIVRCQVTPIDNENVVGETKSVSITINEKSTLSAITGFISKNYKINSLNENVNSIPLTLLFSVLLFIILFITVKNLKNTLNHYIKN